MAFIQIAFSSGLLVKSIVPYAEMSQLLVHDHPMFLCFIHSFNLGPQYISISNHNATNYAVNISPRNVVDWFPDVQIIEEEVLSVVC